MQRSSKKRLAYGGIVLSCLLMTGSVLIPRTYADPARVETPVASSSPITSVVESAVKVKVPLPASVGPHPEECDWLSYLRYRDSDGPAESEQADKILIAQPGILEGAGAFDSVARNTIVAAAAQGKHIEFWALDRRSNCLEDPTGRQAALAANDPAVAVDYYYRNKPVEGRTFAGFLRNDQLGWLANVGLEQTVRDQYALMVKELPDQRVRKQKVLCGGHSLGGVLTGFFTTWDFDGNHATTDDAGYQQCSGTFAFDSTVSTSLNDLNGQEGSALVDPSIGYQATQAGLASGAAPRTVSLPVLINAETMNSLGIAGVAAKTRPDEQSELAKAIPPNFNIDTTLRVLFSKNAATFATGTPSMEDFRVTNEAALGALMDDQSQPLAFLQTSTGFFDGGKIADKDFPLPHELATNPALESLTGMLGEEPAAIPDEPRGPLYTWRNYDRIGAPDDPVYKTRHGAPFTNAGKEVTDIQELARSMAEHPLDFTEQYFPSKLVSDIEQAEAPEVGKDAVHSNGVTANPAINLLGGDGLVVANGTTPAHGVTIIAPGYQHLDVITAAPAQNNGRPEPISASLAEFVGSG